MKRILLWPDTHLPGQHRKAVDALLTYVSVNPPDQVLFLGDLFDFKAVARWSKDTKDECGRLLQAERDAGHEFFTMFRGAFAGPAQVTLGNHEARWTNYLRRYAPGIFGMDGLTIGEVFWFDEFAIDIVKQPHQIAPGVVAIHGERLRQNAGASALAELRRHGRSIVQGHSHRLGIMYETTDRRRFAMECGWLGDITKADYLSFPALANWQLGFGELHVDGQQVTPVPVPVNGANGSFVVNGKRYG